MFGLFSKEDPNLKRNRKAQKKWQEQWQNLEPEPVRPIQKGSYQKRSSRVIHFRDQESPSR